MTLASRRAGRRSALLALVLVLSVPVLAQAATPAERDRVPTPAGTLRTVALGVSQTPNNSLADLDAFAASVGRMPAIWSVWSAWGGSNAAFDTALMDGLEARDVVPMVFWEPADPNDLDSRAFTYRKIIKGKWDAYVRQWARDAKAHGGTILLKFAHEMNATWFPWGVNRIRDNTVDRFKAAWRHIHDLIRGPGGEGATNVKMLWSVYGVCSWCPSHASLYPGNAWVQYVGFSNFDWDGDRTMKRVFSDPVRSLQSFTSKRIIVTETGAPPASAAPSSDPDYKAAWITGGYPAVYRAFPRIKAIVYFNVEVFGQPDWRLTQPAGALTAYAGVVAQARFQGRIK